MINGNERAATKPPAIGRISLKDFLSICISREEVEKKLGSEGLTLASHWHFSQ